jgi:hypothetical protein
MPDALDRISFLDDIRAALDVGKPIITNSECTKTISYDSVTQELTIEFQARGTYKYDGVPSEEYLGLKGAASHGTYFNLYIRDRYSFERIA